MAWVQDASQKCKEDLPCIMIFWRLDAFSAGFDFDTAVLSLNYLVREILDCRKCLRKLPRIDHAREKI